MSTLDLRPISSSSAFVKPAPTVSLLKPWDFSYSPSPDGKDINLLVMCHGLGDNKVSFMRLAKQINLPSTAVLSLSAPDVIPLMDHPSFSWYQTFDPMFNTLPLSSQDPTKHLSKLRNLLETLTSQEIGWKLEDIHLFGWGQGGTMALELGLDIGKSSLKAWRGEDEKRLGSIVSICAPLLSHPNDSLNIATPVLYFARQSPQSAVYRNHLSALKKAFKQVETVHGGGVGEDMPRGREEWWGVMRFWGQVLGKDDRWKGEGETYEVVR
ncbi:uncharacterized protein L203_101394 [Cryptococcus depauperatus CBS 7841]|uniref:Uncharacterized protein n=1 Tax=Cryptococcus depauperatus CBS 7841 TaxID=1295531 RepID=A0A1E3IC01_9TREE|nr:hypothetical protein L203_04245 [Cryptococcus depauperatus CBS 7841]